MNDYVRRFKSNEVTDLISRKRKEKNFKYNADEDEKLIAELNLKLGYEPQPSQWKNFLQGNNLDFKVFKSCCEVLDIEWHQIIDWDSFLKNKDNSKSKKEIEIQRLIKNNKLDEARKIILEIIPKKILEYEISANNDLYFALKHLLASAEQILYSSTKSQDKSDLYLQIGNIHDKTGDYRESLKNYQNSFKYCSNEKQKFESLLGIAVMKLNLCDFSNSYKDLVKLIDLSKSSSQYIEITKKTTFFLAWTLIYIDLDQSISTFTNLINEIEEDDPLKPGIYHFLGRNKSKFIYREKILESIDMYKKQIDIEIRYHSFREHSIGHCFRWMSESYLTLAKLNQDRTENLKDSKYYLDISKNIFEPDYTRKDKGGLKFIPFHEAKILLFEDEIDRAFYKIEESIAIFEEVKYEIGLVEAYKLLQEIQFALIIKNHKILAKKAFQKLTSQNLIRIDNKLINWNINS